MKDILRDSTVGQFLNSVSGGHILPYADQKPGFVFPDRSQGDSFSGTSTMVRDSTGTMPPPRLNKERPYEENGSNQTLPVARDIENVQPDAAKMAKKADLNLVDWYGPDDPDNPRFVESMSRWQTLHWH
jgi:MFS transporter, DHA1 family, multidrug resistance protein